jgi:hypothetical protein
MKVHLTVARGAGILLVDGHDISRNVHRDGVALDLSDLDHPRVTLTLMPDELLVDGDVLVELEHTSLAEREPAAVEGR